MSGGGAPAAARPAGPAGDRAGGRPGGRVDWDRLRLAVFDLDGTLYSQARLRRRLLPRLALAAAAAPDLLRIVPALRRAREDLAEAGARDFEDALFARAAARARAPEARVRAVARDWLLDRPLPHLAACRIPGAPEVFAALRARGLAVAVWSDYPAAAKLAALGLRADLVLSAHDAEVGVQKPDPRGLAVAAARAGAAPAQVLMIGDRPERDGAAAARFGAAFLHRGRRGDFRRFDEAEGPFAPLLAPAP